MQYGTVWAYICLLLLASLICCSRTEPKTEQVHGQSNLTKRPHRHCTRRIQSYSPGRANSAKRALPSNAWFLGPTRAQNSNGISIGSAVFAGLTIVSDRQTDQPHYTPSVTIGRVYVAYVVLPCTLKSNEENFLKLELKMFYQT